MKRAIFIIISVVLLGVIGIVGTGIYITNTLEYALKVMIDDVGTSGMDGLYPHLTGKAKTTMEAVSAVADNRIVSTLAGFIGQSEYVGILKSKMQEIQWSVRDVLKSKENVSVILSFNYEDKLVGTMELSMLKEGGEWKISGVDFPEFEKINW